MLNGEFCPIFHAGDKITVVISNSREDTFIFTTITKVNKTTYKANDMLFL